MSKEKKDPTIPHYTKNIYLSQIKHLTRTLNNLIAYESVKKIFVKFSKSKNKYQLFLDINDKVEEIDYSDKLILVYDKSLADTMLYNEKEIFSILDTPTSKYRQQQDVLDNLATLIKKYTSQVKSNGYNTFFKENEEEVLNEITSILPDNVITQYKPKNRKEFVKTMVEKKIYFLIKNQLNFVDIIKVKDLRDEISDSKQNIISLVEQEIRILNQNITYLKMEKTQHIFPSEMEEIATKRELQNAIKHYYDDSVEKYNLEAYSLEELEEQLFLIESKNEVSVYEEKPKSHIDKINLEIGLKVQRYFEDFIIFVDYCKKNKKNFTPNSISRYIANVENQLISARKLSVSNRKRKIREIQHKYQNILDMNKDEKFYYITKLTELYKNAKLYSNISNKLDDALEFLNLYIPIIDEEFRHTGVSKEIKQEVSSQIAKEKKEEIALNKKANDLGISKNEYEFNIFSKNLLVYIHSIMEFPFPISIKDFLIDKNKMIDYLKNMYDGYELSQHIQDYNNILNEIDKFKFFDIYEKIKNDLIADGYEIDEEIEKNKYISPFELEESKEVRCVSVLSKDEIQNEDTNKKYIKDDDMPF